jgi:parallel beta-helix repeat protein
LVICGFIGFLITKTENVQGTDVSGVINSDTTWNISGSPYFVVGDVIVVMGVNLTIEPGVEVRFNGSYTIEVNGNLKAMGEPENEIIFTSNSSSPVIEDWNTIQINATGNAEITYCNISYARSAITVSGSYDIIIENNEISSNYDGIRLYMSQNSSVSQNNITNNYNMGIFLSETNNSRVLCNNITGNFWHGIHLYRSSFNNIKNNNISDNFRGIFGAGSSGIETKNNTIEQNRISSNNDGIRLQAFTNLNNITRNNISENYGYGVHLSSNSNNLIFHNIFWNNSIQAYDDTANNFWDNDYPSGGNYWSDFDEPSEGAYDNYKGPNQDILGSDGIVDNGTIGGGGKNPYVIDSDSQDTYPLIAPFTNITFNNYTVLKKGWNLISIPFIQDNQNLTKVLEMINGWYDAVQWYNPSHSNKPWKHHKVGKSFGNDLILVNESMGFWIHITNPGDTIFLYNGTHPTSNQSIPLHPGWNMVGYPSLTNRNRTAALNNLTFGSEVDAVWTFNNANKNWEEIKAGDYFEVGRGYWVHATQECVWEVGI